MKMTLDRFFRKKSKSLQELDSLNTCIFVKAFNLVRILKKVICLFMFPLLDRANVKYINKFIYIKVKKCKIVIVIVSIAKMPDHN